MSDTDIERLLAGAPSPEENPDPLAGFFAALADDSDDRLDETTVARLVAAAVEASATPRRPSPARTPRHLVGSLKRRAAALAVAVTAFVGGTSGLALAADGAKPGDALYGVDRALETVGIGAGGEQERLSEAEALVDAGDVQRGLQHAAETVTGVAADSAAATALQNAANRVEAAGAGDSAAEGVSELLSYLAANIGDVDGAQVADLAGNIARPEPPVTPGQPDDPSDTPGNSPASPPGLANNDPATPAGPPAEPPGLEDKDPGPPAGVNPPGLEDKDPGPPAGVNPPGLEDKTPGPPDKS